MMTSWWTLFKALGGAFLEVGVLSCQGEGVSCLEAACPWERHGLGAFPLEGPWVGAYQGEDPSCLEVGLLCPQVEGVLLCQVGTVWAHLQCWRQLQLLQRCHGLVESSLVVMGHQHLGLARPTLRGPEALELQLALLDPLPDQYQDLQPHQPEGRAQCQYLWEGVLPQSLRPDSLP